MKIQEIKTSKFDGFGVLVQDGMIGYSGLFSSIVFKVKDKPNVIVSFPPGQYKIIGIQTEITEEQAKEIVDELAELIFKDYIPQTNGLGMSCFDTALESFSSLMQKLEMYSENPYREEPIRNIEVGVSKLGSWVIATNPKYNQWQEAQSKVGNRLIIQKIK